MSRKRKEVFAIWDVRDYPKPQDVYISQGAADDEQGEAFSPWEIGAKLTIECYRDKEKHIRYTVTLTAPTCGLEKTFAGKGRRPRANKNYWLSPCALGYQEIEAHKWGIRDKR
jgi:hypothetical protein